MPFVALKTLHFKHIVYYLYIDVSLSSVHGKLIKC